MFVVLLFFFFFFFCFLSFLSFPPHLLLSSSSPPPLLLSHTKDFRGDTAVHATSVNGYIACLQLLLQSGAEVDIPNRKGQLPTHMARDSNSMQTLIDHSGDIFGVDNVGRTTLFTAAANGRVTTVVGIFFFFQNVWLVKYTQACRADSTFHFCYSWASFLPLSVVITLVVCSIFFFCCS